MCFTSSNHVNTFSLDFAFSFANILSLIAFIISYRLFADKLRLTPSTLLARFIPITKIRNPLLKILENAAKSRILLACKHYNFNIHVSLATDILHLLLKGLQKAIIQQLIAIISLLFISKAPFALHFIYVVCDLVTLAQYKSYNEDTLQTLEEEKNFNYLKALDSIYTRANSEAYYITIVKQFYSIINKKDKVAANIVISNFIYAAAQFSSKRYNDPKYCNEKLYLILIIIDYICYDKDRKYIAYIRAFSKVLLFNNNKQINNTTRILTFKFYNLSTIICLVHLVLRDLPNLTTHTTMSYYVNNYIN
ncbi:hypothetical protein HBI09_195170 [Parastagonospora nodorum]|nr:hypothetical protein HBI09_195170 [Parastagonospora nodorum]